MAGVSGNWMRGVKLKELELFIQSIPPFERPQVKLEQYATPSTLAARLLWIAETRYGDIVDRAIVDLGAGTGRLGLGALYLGASEALLVDVDGEALKAACRRAGEAGMGERAGCLTCDVEYLPLRAKRFDTVLENPPFGVHSRGADVRFLSVAAALGRVVYSIHKLPTLRFVSKKALELGCSSVETILVDKICIPPVFFFHTRRMHCVDIVALRIVCKGV